MNKKYQVSVTRCGGRSIKDTISEGMERIGGIEKYVRTGQKVMLKPNYTGDLDPKTGAVTSVEVLEGIILYLHDHGITDITIAEGCGTVHIGTMKIFENVGVAAMAERYHIPLVDLNKCPVKTLTDKRFRELKEVKVSEGLFGYDLIINVPVIKTHAQCVFTCAVKNMKGGVAPKEKRHFHALNLHQSIADFQLVLPKTITIVDGLIGQEGMGPAEGDPVPLDIIICGENAVAVDGVVMAIAKINPQTVKHVVYAADMGIGSWRLEDIEVLGIQVDEFTHAFRRAETELTEFEGVEIYNMGACSGCINSLVIALNRIKKAGDLSKFKDLQVNIGHGKPENTEYKNFFYIGKCGQAVCERECKKGKQVHFISGCAPAALEIEERIREVYGIERSL